MSSFLPLCASPQNQQRRFRTPIRFLAISSCIRTVSSSLLLFQKRGRSQSLYAYFSANTTRVRYRWKRTRHMFLSFHLSLLSSNPDLPRNFKHHLAQHNVLTYRSGFPSESESNIAAHDKQIQRYTQLRYGGFSTRSKQNK